MEKPSGITEEQSWRANTYNLLATLLQAPPEQCVVESLQEICLEKLDYSEQPIGQAWTHLSHAAQETRLEQVREEYHKLFIGINRGEILPYASWYLTGFLMEKPLAQLRNDLLTLGIKRHENVCEPEDHVAALFEVMTLLIRSNDSRQNPFFEQHIAPWAPRLFKDIANARQSNFYYAVANLAAEFIHLEQKLVELAQPPNQP